MERGERRPTIIASYGHAVAAALEAAGLDARAVFASAEVPFASASDPLLRIGNRDVTRLFKKAVEASGNPYFGLSVAEHMHLSSLHALGYALIASENLRDFCARLDNYYRLVSENARISIAVAHGELQIVAERPTDPDICIETQDAFIGLIVRLILYISDPRNPLLRVELARAQPEDGGNAYREHFRCPVVFGQPQLRIVMDASQADQPLLGGNRELAQLNDQTVIQYLARLDREDIVNRVRAILVNGLSAGALTQQHVAGRLNMSPRNLQLKLAARDTSFQAILDSTRQSLAIGYMTRSSVTTTEIAYMLGFSDLSNFTRAFRRWTGKSPSEYRQMLRDGKG